MLYLTLRKKKSLPFSLCVSKDPLLQFIFKVTEMNSFAFPVRNAINCLIKTLLFYFLSVFPLILYNLSLVFLEIRPAWPCLALIPSHGGSLPGFRVSETQRGRASVTKGTIFV